MEPPFKIINRKILVVLFLAVTVALYFLFGFYHLTKFVTADEHYWVYERIPQYWQAISDHKWSKTLISDKPGISLALLSGISLTFEKDPDSHKIENYENMDFFDTARTEKLYLAFRLPILILNGLLLILLFWLVKKVVENDWIALWSTILTALTPALLGISQIVNPDALLWSFGAAAIFSYLALLKYGQKKYLAMASIFVGFSILTKYASLILFPFFLLLLFFSFSTNFTGSAFFDSASYKRKQIINFFLIFLFSALIVMTFLPLTFVEPSQLYATMFGFSGKMKLAIWLTLAGAFLFGLDVFFLKNKFPRFFKKIVEKYSGAMKILFPFMAAVTFILIIGRNIYPAQNWKLFQKIPFDLQYLFSAPSRAYGLKLWEALILQFNSLFFSLTPVVLFLLLFLWVKYPFVSKHEKYYYYTLLLTAFVLLYEISLVFLNVLAIIRYNIILYPIAAFLAAIGVWKISEFLEKKTKRLHVNPTITIFLIVISFPSLWLIKPFYFNYTNFLLPKKNIITDAWGYGGYEAAQYLNSLPHSDKLVVWSDYRGVCEFFKGKCFTKYAFDQEKYEVDYYVLTRRGKIRYYGENSRKWKDKDDAVQAKSYYSKKNPEWLLEIDGRPDNYVKIVKADE